MKDMTYEEIELLSYTDLLFTIKENKQPMNTPTNLENLWFTNMTKSIMLKPLVIIISLTIDKRFVLLENNEWDIRDHHSIAITLDEEDDDDFISDDDEDEEEVIAETTEGLMIL